MMLKVKGDIQNHQALELLTQMKKVSAVLLNFQNLNRIVVSSLNGITLLLETMNRKFCLKTKALLVIMMNTRLSLD
jgi:hypothetical protein